MGRLVELGSFYYGATDQINPGENFWSYDDIENGRRLLSQPATLHHEVQIVRNFSDRLYRAE